MLSEETTFSLNLNLAYQAFKHRLAIERRASLDGRGASAGTPARENQNEMVEPACRCTLPRRQNRHRHAPAAHGRERDSGTSQRYARGGGCLVRERARVRARGHQVGIVTLTRYRPK